MAVTRAFAAPLGRLRGVPALRVGGPGLRPGPWRRAWPGRCGGRPAGKEPAPTVAEAGAHTGGIACVAGGRRAGDRSFGAPDTLTDERRAEVACRGCSALLSTTLALSSYAYYDAFMAKARITISLEQDKAKRIRQHAERAGMDVSAYLVHAATRQMAESDAIEEQFAEVDALIARAERAADGLPAEATREPAVELTEQERREVEEALGLVQGRDRQGRRPGHAA